MDDFDLKFETMLLTQRDEYRKRYKGLAAQVEALGSDPDDGPLWLRIANQRRELEALQKVVERLKESHAEHVREDGPIYTCNICDSACN